MTTKTLVELDEMLDELDRDLRMLMMDGAGSDDLWAVFAAQADAIEAVACAEDIGHVHVRTTAMLTAQGIVPPTEESAS